MTTHDDADRVRLVLITTPLDAGRPMARLLVEKRLAACVNVVPKVESHYWWQGAVKEDAEALLICKTSQAKIGELMTWVNETHSYDIPEVTVLPLSTGLPDYLAWVRKETEG